MRLILVTHKGKVEDDTPAEKPVAKKLSALVVSNPNLDLSKRYRFDEYRGDGVPAGIVIKTGEEILEEYWPFWKEQMVNNFGENDARITFHNCIDDFCVVNWAWEVDANGEKIS